MLIEALATANLVRVMSAARKCGAGARFTDIRNAAGLGDAQVSRAIKEMSKRGLLLGKPQANRTMRYSLTKAGRELVALVGEMHEIVHGRPGTVSKSADKEFEAILVF